MALLLPLATLPLADEIPQDKLSELLEETCNERYGEVISVDGFRFTFQNLVINFLANYSKYEAIQNLNKCYFGSDLVCPIYTSKLGKKKSNLVCQRNIWVCLNGKERPALLLKDQRIYFQDGKPVSDAVLSLFSRGIEEAVEYWQENGEDISLSSHDPDNLIYRFVDEEQQVYAIIVYFRLNDGRIVVAPRLNSEDIKSFAKDLIVVAP